MSNHLHAPHTARRELQHGVPVRRLEASQCVQFLLIYRPLVHDYTDSQLKHAANARPKSRILAVLYNAILESIFFQRVQQQQCLLPQCARYREWEQWAQRQQWLHHLEQLTSIR